MILPAASVGAVAAVVCALLAVSGCQSGEGSATRGTGGPTAAPDALPRAPYIDMVDRITAQKATAWIEVDLVKAWQVGGKRYGDAVNIVVELASRPGVAGIKIADELGYNDGIDTPKQAQEFLAKASGDIRSRLPDTKILVDMIVPQLGCLAWVAEPVTESERRDCAATEGNANPAATIDAVEGYLESRALDVFNLSAGLRDTVDYSSWNTAPDEAMRAIWTEVNRRQWGLMVTLQARKAFAHSGTYHGGTAQAEQDLRTFVDIPLANGAHAVDIWTWSQPYKGTTYRLSDPGLATNPLIAGLARRRTAGAHLFTHMTPSSLVVSVETDVSAATAIFRSVFVAAGAG